VVIRVALKMVIFQKTIFLTVSPLKCVPFDEKSLCGKLKQYILKFRGSSMTLKNQKNQKNRYKKSIKYMPILYINSLFSNVHHFLFKQFTNL